MERRNVVVEGALAYRMRRVEAARAAELGLDVLTISTLAARLAGGFTRAADHATLVPAVGRALQELSFEELEGVKGRPGMARAVLSSLGRVWNADLALDDPAFTGPRLNDLRLIETHLREHLPAGALLPRDLRDKALGGVRHAPATVGSVHFHRLITVEPLWRPLVEALAQATTVTWEAPGALARKWFSGTITPSETRPARPMLCETCADPRAEVVEALRWARALLADGTTQASDIAIASADPTAWDDHMLVLAADADLPLHFASGVSALSTPVGQACAALADAMINGISQDRVRRLSLLSPQLSETLPADWMRGIPAEAGLFEPQHWARSLGALSRPDATLIASTLMPVINELQHGVASASQLAVLLLRGKSLGLWQEATRLAPAAAMEMTLASLRVADERDPGNSVVWARAADLVGAPRRHMRLIGLSSRAWPRSDMEDPLLPEHVVSRHTLVDLSRLARDRLAFEILTRHPGSDVTLSRSRRSAEGTVLARSALLQRDVTDHTLARTRIPEHAFSEGDRLLARPDDALALPRTRSILACWTDWTRKLDATPHDGGFRPDHPALLRALGAPQSATSLRRLLRDPLGYVWRRAMGMTAPELAIQPLQLDAATFGDLVHELLKLAVDAIEPRPGLVRATPDEIAAALHTAARAIADSWPLTRAVPPRLLWLDTIDEARRRAHRGLTLDERFGAGTRSFSEVEFGDQDARLSPPDPWPRDHEVVVGQRGIRLKGRIDRIDVKADRRGARISDYKTGNTPRDQGSVILGGGTEVQRALYAVTARQLIPEVTSVLARLVYLDTMDAPAVLEGETLERAEETLQRFIDIAFEQLRSGAAHPGPDAFVRYNDLRIALPANLDGYRNRKEEAFNASHHRLAPLWSMP